MYANFELFLIWFYLQRFFATSSALLSRLFSPLIGIEAGYFSRCERRTCDHSIGEVEDSNALNRRAM